MRSHVHLKEILAALGPRGLTAYWTIGDVASRTRQALPFPTSFIQGATGMIPDKPTSPPCPPPQGGRGWLAVDHTNAFAAP